jgi:hypothetical protein
MLLLLPRGGAPLTFRVALFSGASACRRGRAGSRAGAVGGRTTSIAATRRLCGKVFSTTPLGLRTVIFSASRGPNRDHRASKILRARPASRRSYPGGDAVDLLQAGDVLRGAS